MRIIRAADLDFVPASHEDPSCPGVLKKVLATKDELLDGRVQMINWARLPAGNSFRAHYHEDMEEVFVLVSGKVEMVVNDTNHSIGIGDAIIVSPREIHSMTNVGPSDAEYIVLGISLGLGGKTVVV